MEVHKHPNHVTHSKKWTEYVLEFLMLFLAVFLGFIAESYREQLVEREREKEYMHSMLADLQADSLNCVSSIARNEVFKKGRDSMVEYIYTNKQLTPNDLKQLYYYTKKYTTSITMLYKERTLSQLKNAGGYRLIKHQNVSDSILNYQLGIEWQAGQNEGILVSSRELRNKSEEIFDKYVINKYNSPEELLQSKETFTLLDNNRKTLLIYLNKFIDRNNSINNNIKEQKKQLARCLDLIHLIKKEYHLEDE